MDSSSRIYYGGTFFDNNDLLNTNVKHKVELEYYKTNNCIKEDSESYGIEVIKKEYINNKVCIETSNIKHITKDESRANEILEKLKKFKVTPIALQDVVDDLIWNKKLSILINWSFYFLLLSY